MQPSYKKCRHSQLFFAEQLEQRRLLSVSFAPVQTYPTGGTEPQGLCVADFNGDGLPDVAVTNISSGTVTVLLNQGNGTFNALTPFNVGPNVSGITAADFNGDGKPDLAVVGDDLAICLNLGGGMFGAPAHIAVGQIPQFVVSADFNGDGKPDLAVSNLGSNSVSILLGTGGGNFSAPTTVSGINGACGLAAGDFNGDNKVDLAVTSLGVYNSSANTFGTSSGVFILTGKGDGTFTVGTPIPIGTRPETIAAGDVNGDGKLDLVAENGAFADPTGDDSVSVLLNTGSGTFAAPVGYLTGENPESVALADVNGDSKLDIITANYGGSDVTVLTNMGNGTFDSPIYLPGLNFNGTVVAADVNGDNKPDLIVDGFNDGTLGVLLNTFGVTPTATLVSSNPTPGLGQSVMLTATVAAGAGNSGTPTGTVKFFSNGVSIGSASLDSTGIATLTTSSLALGVDSITANYGGDANFSTASSAPVTETVSQSVAATVLSLDSSDLLPNSGTSVTLTATAAVPSGDLTVPTGAVTFFSNGVSIGSANLDAQGTAMLVTATLADGSDAITASYAGDVGDAPATSSAVTETITPASSLLPTLAGVLPPAIAGQKINIHQTLTLTDMGSAFSGVPMVQLYLATGSVVDSNAIALPAPTGKELKIKAGKHANVALKLNSIPASVPPGSYHLLARITDGTGDTALDASSNTLAVAAAEIDLGGHFVKTPKAPKAGKPVNASIMLTNNGNVIAVGDLAIVVYTSTSSTLDGNAVQAISLSKHVNLKPGKSMSLPLNGIPLPVASGSYYVIVQLDPQNVFQDGNLSNNVFATLGTIMITS